MIGILKYYNKSDRRNFLAEIILNPRMLRYQACPNIKRSGASSFDLQPDLIFSAFSLISLVQTIK